jgi:hypothetical protein
MPHRVVIRDQHIGSEHSTLEVRVEDDGRVVFDGCDAGPLAERAFGDGDFEYWLTIPAAERDRLLCLLLAERFDSVHKAAEWLGRHEIRFDRTSF